MKIDDILKKCIEIPGISIKAVKPVQNFFSRVHPEKGP